MTWWEATLALVVAFLAGWHSHKFVVRKIMTAALKGLAMIKDDRALYEEAVRRISLVRNKFEDEGQGGRR